MVKQKLEKTDKAHILIIVYRRVVLFGQRDIELSTVGHRYHSNPFNGATMILYRTITVLLLSISIDYETISS